jgi:hypothetical protein
MNIYVYICVFIYIYTLVCAAVMAKLFGGKNKVATKVSAMDKRQNLARQAQLEGTMKKRSKHFGGIYWQRRHFILSRGQVGSVLRSVWVVGGLCAVDAG